MQNYISGFKPRPHFEDVVNKRDKKKLHYPPRTYIMRDSLYYDNLSGMPDPEFTQQQERVKLLEGNVSKIATDLGLTHHEVKQYMSDMRGEFLPKNLQVALEKSRQKETRRQAQNALDEQIAAATKIQKFGRGLLARKRYAPMQEFTRLGAIDFDETDAEKRRRVLKKLAALIDKNKKQSLEKMKSPLSPSSADPAASSSASVRLPPIKEEEESTSIAKPKSRRSSLQSEVFGASPTFATTALKGNKNVQSPDHSTMATAADAKKQLTPYGGRGRPTILQSKVKEASKKIAPLVKKAKRATDKKLLSEAFRDWKKESE